MARTKATEQATEEQVVEQSVTAKSKKTVVIPPYADKVLKMYTDYEQLYVSKYGGAYPVDTPEFVRGDAILFTNPYYNK